MDIKNLFHKAVLGTVLGTAITLCALLPALSQQAQTSLAPIQPYNAKYVQGVGPGYWPTAGAGLVLNLSAGTVICSNAGTNYTGGTLTMANNTTNFIYLNTASSCVPATKTTAFAAGDIPIAKVVTVSSAITTITDLRTMFSSAASGSFLDPGSNGIVVRTALNTSTADSIAATTPITVTNATGVAGNPTLACPTCTITIFHGTATLGTSAIASGACATTVTVAATGTLTTDTVTATANADLSAVTGYVPATSGILTIYTWPTANQVNVHVCNGTAGSITPSAVILNIGVTR